MTRLASSIGPSDRRLIPDAVLSMISATRAGRAATRSYGPPTEGPLTSLVGEPLTIDVYSGCSLSSGANRAVAPGPKRITMSRLACEPWRWRGNAARGFHYCRL